MILDQTLEAKTQDLLEKASLSNVIISIKNISNGGNNRTYKIETTDGIFAVKKYFRQHSDHRDRLATEYKFLSYAQDVAPNYVPKAYSKNDEEGLALYEFITASPITMITDYEVAEARCFFQQLNQFPKKNAAIHLSNASEACFSIQDHLNLISKRINILQSIKPEIEEDNSAKYFIEEMIEKWKSMLDQANELAIFYGIDVGDALEFKDRCISPSDFGFHNALRMSDGSIKFIDFEYAGWDDPAKLIGDFFSQLAVPVPKLFFDSFCGEALSIFDQADSLIARAKILYPVYQIKWCCIALNIFIAEHLERRQFANPKLDIVAVKKAQLLKAQSLLSSINTH
jgi:hypothetical protein